MDKKTLQTINSLIAAGKGRDEIKATLVSKGTDTATVDDLLDTMHPASVQESLVTPTSAQPVAVSAPIQPSGASLGASGAQPSNKNPTGRPKVLMPVSVLIVIGVLLAGVGIHNRLERIRSTTTPPAQSAGQSNGQSNQAQNNTSQAGTSQSGSSTSSQPTGGNGYFSVVSADLTKIGQLSQPMDQSCAVKFPPPEPCASDLQAYQQELLSAKADLSKVTAPASFQQADTTMRGALATDIQATDQASSALQARNLGQWLSALALHGQAGQQLDTALAQAQSAAN